MFVRVLDISKGMNYNESIRERGSAVAENNPFRRKKHVRRFHLGLLQWLSPGAKPRGARPRAGGKDRLPRAVAFVDYEHWYFSMENLYHTRPDVGAWVENMKKRAVLTEIVFFADFSKFRTRSEEIKRIREYSNKIIDTFNPDLHYKKDYTDFIMLDNIYQRANDAETIDMFIIFTGDGHFSSVASYLKNIRGKEVGIYGVRQALSNHLKNIADWYIELPEEKQLLMPYYHMILRSLKKNEEKMRGKASFRKTVELTAERENVREEQISDCLSKLIENGYITQTDERGSRGAVIKALHVEWEKLKRDGYWPPEQKETRVLSAK